MGAWGHLAFDNDTACDWSYELEDAGDLGPVEAAFSAVEDVGSEYLDQDLACNALAACEVLARLQGRAGYSNSYTETVDGWVAAHRLAVSPALLKRAAAAIDRILGEASELRELWEESADAPAWRQGVAELRTRVVGR